MPRKTSPLADSKGKTLDKKAKDLLNSGKYKDAIELFKRLLRNSDNSEWRRQLAFCYLQRAKTFAEKGLLKEAQVLWENYRQHAQPPYEAYDQYLFWSVQTQKPDALRATLKQLTARQLDKDYPELATVFGALVLTGNSELAQALPQDSVFCTHLKIAQNALRCYRDQDPAGMDEALKQLPYRSAFRDFRTLLKASVAASTSRTETESLLRKIAATSPYSQAARLLLACTCKGSALAHELLGFNPPQRRLIEEITGLNQQQVEFVKALDKQKTPFSDKIKFNLAARFQSLFGADLAQRFCLATLATYPAGRRDYVKTFGTLDEFEENRLLALNCERDNNYYDAAYYWRQCIKALTQQGGKDYSLKIALILRHMTESQPEPKEQILLLTESLEHDPDDKDCYLQILRHYGQMPDTADGYKQWLDQALDKFPQDIDVLTLATQAATNNKTYKKAIQYASKLLQIDPLNTFAKQIVFSSHLAHARRLIKTKKYHRAEDEIRQAEALRPGKNQTLHTQMMKAFLCFASDDKAKGLQMIAETLSKLNTGPVAAHFQAAIEALLNGLPVATVLRAMPPADAQLLSPQELTRLIELITQYRKEDDKHELISKALNKIKAPLKQSVLRQNYQEDLLLTLCQALDSIRHFELLRHCSKKAHAKWHKPIWRYYRIYSETNDDPSRCKMTDVFGLQHSLEQARRERDQRTAALIGRYLERYYEAHPSRGLDFLEDLFEGEEQDEYDDPLDELFGHLPDEVFIKLDKKLASLAKKTSPERLVQEFNKVAGNNSNILVAMMQEPALFTALLIIKAAGELGIDIDVTVEDVLEYFDIGKPSRSFPFPF